AGAARRAHVEGGEGEARGRDGGGERNGRGLQGRATRQARAKAVGAPHGAGQRLACQGHLLGVGALQRDTQVRQVLEAQGQLFDLCPQEEVVAGGDGAAANAVGRG